MDQQHCGLVDVGRCPRMVATLGVGLAGGTRGLMVAANRADRLSLAGSRADLELVAGLGRWRVGGRPAGME